MKSKTPKVLTRIGGELLLNLVLRSLRQAGVGYTCLVVNKNLLPHLIDIDLQDDTVCIQEQQLGTGHALASACVAIEGLPMPSIGDRILHKGKKISCEHLLVCPADVPAIKADTITSFLTASLGQTPKLHVIGMRLKNSYGYGRLLVRDGILQKIVEEKDASTTEKSIGLCNSGVMLISTQVVTKLLSSLQRNNNQQEFYLPDIFAAEKADVYIAADASQFWGVNNYKQLAKVERLLIQRRITELMMQGVRFVAPNSTHVDLEVEISSNSTVESCVTLLGSTKIGSGCVIRSCCRLENVTVEDGATIGHGVALTDSIVPAGKVILADKV